MSLPPFDQDTDTPDDPRAAQEPPSPDPSPEQTRSGRLLRSSRKDSRFTPAKADPQEQGYLKNLGYDLPASLVVFLVALPLCLGIAVASGAPPLAGLIAGAVGGVMVGALSGSHLAVSGPAAGLTTIVLSAIAALEFEGFLLAGAIAGVLQIVLGFARAGIFAYYIPSSVIKGMLAAIGIILIIKQIPHALGDDLDFEGDLTLLTQQQMGPFEALAYAFRHIEPGAVIIASLGLTILILWSKVPQLDKFKWLPAPLLVVAMGIGLNLIFSTSMPAWELKNDHLVSIAVGGPRDLWNALIFPDFARITEGAIWSSAVTIAAVASLETLLCIEAIDKLDPYKRTTPTNRELVAQGGGNLVSSLIGGLPLTAVIVRGTANIHSGARTKASAVLHGMWLVLAVLALAWLLNLIPLAALAAILLHVGYKLTNLNLVRSMLRQHVDTWLPFVVTVVAILLLDLLRGVGVGMAVGLFFILRENLANPFFEHRRESQSLSDGEHLRIELSENVSFLNKASVNRLLQRLPRGSVVEIDGSGSHYIHSDVVELLREFEVIAGTRGIRMTLRDIPETPKGGGGGH